MERLEAALGYLKRGWAPIPLAPRSKVPPRGFKLRNYFKSPMAESELAAVWKTWPDAGVGIVMGAASKNLIAVDIDPRNASLETIRRTLHQLGIPPTFTTFTGGGGWHYLYRASALLPKKIGAYNGIDLIGQGGYVVMPPSIHLSGKPYEILYDIDIAPAPDWVENKMGEAMSAPNRTIISEITGDIKEGERNNTLFHAACGFARGDCFYCGNRRCRLGTPEHLFKRAMGFNKKRMDPPLSAEEVWGISKNAMRYALADNLRGAATINIKT